ncbi:Arginine--tRNA ligase cytoplasmic-like protein [Colletotrichum asianum]
MSICVTGCELPVWTAICLADTWFDESDPNNEDQLDFYENIDDADPNSCPLDALSGGNLTADDKAITDPREYFLQLVKFRVEKVAEEWKLISHRLDDKVRQYLRDSHISLPRRETSLGTAKDESTAIVKSEYWVKRTGDILNSLIDTLSKIVGSWDEFVPRDWNRLVYETHEKIVERIDLSVWEITEQMDELNHVLKGLRSLKSKIDNFMGKLSLHIAVDGNRTVPLQYWNVTVVS